MLEIYVTYYQQLDKGAGKYKATVTLLKDDTRIGSASGTFPTVAAVRRWGRDWKKARKAKYLTIEGLR